MGKLSLLLQKQQEEQAKSDLPERTRQEPTVPLTARAVGGGGGGGGGKEQDAYFKRFKSWNNEGISVPAVPLSARNSSAQLSGTSTPLKQEEDTEARAEADKWERGDGGGAGKKTPVLPITPAQVLRQYKSAMSLYEQGEILDYPQVYLIAVEHGP